MNKSKIFILVAFLMLPLLSACSTNTTDIDVPQTGTTETTQSAFSRPEIDADITGIVTSITGNEIVVAKIEMADMVGMNNKTPQSEEASEAEEKTTLSLTSTQMGGMPGGGPGGGAGGGMPGEGDGSNRDSMVAEMLKNSTGKVTVTVPVGIAMTKRSGATEEEAILTDIETNMMVEIWLNDSVDDRNIAEFVSMK